MKRAITVFSLFIIAGGLLYAPHDAEARGRASGRTYFRSARSGRFVTSGYSATHKTTTYRSTFRRSK